MQTVGEGGLGLSSRTVMADVAKAVGTWEGTLASPGCAQLGVGERFDDIYTVDVARLSRQRLARAMVDLVLGSRRRRETSVGRVQNMYLVVESPGRVIMCCLTTVAQRHQMDIIHIGG